MDTRSHPRTNAAHTHTLLDILGKWLGLGRLGMPSFQSIGPGVMCKSGIGLTRSCLQGMLIFVVLALASGAAWRDPNVRAVSHSLHYARNALTEITYETGTAGGVPANLQQTFQLPKFNPTLGQLDAVTITAVTTVTFDVVVENQSPSTPNCLFRAYLTTTVTTAPQGLANWVIQLATTTPPGKCWPANANTTSSIQNTGTDVRSCEWFCLPVCLGS